MKECVICNIVNDILPSSRIFENENFIVFLDKKPIFLGHCLLAPKTHYPTIYDLPAELHSEYLVLVKGVGKAVETAMSAAGSFIAMNNIVSQSIPHLHTHIVPRNFKDGLKGFFWPRTTYKSIEEMTRVQEAIMDVLKVSFSK